MWHDDSFDAGIENAVKKASRIPLTVFTALTLRGWTSRRVPEGSLWHFKCTWLKICVPGLLLKWFSWHAGMSCTTQMIAAVVIVVTWQRFDFDYEEKVRKRRAGSVAWDSESWSARSRGVCARDIEGRVGRNIDKEMWTLVDRCIVGTKLEKIRWF